MICTSRPEAVVEPPTTTDGATEMELTTSDRQLSPCSPGSFVSSKKAVQNESETIASDGIRRIVKSTHIAMDDEQRAKKCETTVVILPNNALADNIDDDDDDDDDEEDNNLEWSPRSAQSIPSLLDEENAANIALRDRSNSELTLEPCLDAAIIETSQGLFLPHLIPEEDGRKGRHVVVAAPPLRRYTTPPAISKGKLNADADITVVTPPTTPESSHFSSSMIMEEDGEDAGECGRRSSTTTNSATAKTPKRSNRGNNGGGSIDSPDVIIFNEIQRKRSLQIKNFFRRLAKPRAFARPN